MKANSFRAGQTFFGFPSKKAVFHYSGEVFKQANEALDPSLKDLARRGSIFFTKHKRPISSEGLTVLYAANQLGLNAPERFANSAWFNTILYFGKRDRENQRKVKPGELQLKTTTSRLKYFISSEGATKNHSTFKCSRFYTFFLVKFLNSTSEYMNQKRQVFEFLIQGALRELISHDSLSNLVQFQWK